MPKAAEILNSPERSKVLEHTLRKAARDTLRKQEQAGNPIVVWRDGEAVWLPAEEIPDDEEV